MTKLSLGAYPHMLGFEQLERLWKEQQSLATSYHHLTLNRHRNDLIGLLWLLLDSPKVIYLLRLKTANW